MNKNSNDMKEQLTIISDDLNHGIITEKEARTKLLILFGVRLSLPSEDEQDQAAIDHCKEVFFENDIKDEVMVPF